MELIVLFHAQKNGTNIILSSFKKSIYKSGTKIVPYPPFLFRLGPHINSP